MTAKEPNADNQTYYKAYEFFESQRTAKKAPKSKKRKELEQALNDRHKQEEVRRQTLAPHQAAAKLLIQHYPNVGKALASPICSGNYGAQHAEPIPTLTNPLIVELLAKGWSQLGALLAVIDLDVAFRYPITEPAPWKAGKSFIELQRGSRSDRMSREIDWIHSMDAFRNFQRLKKDVEIARQARATGRVLTRQLPSTPPPLDIEIDMLDGSIHERKRSSYELEGDHSQCCCDRIRSFRAVYHSIPPKPPPALLLIESTPSSSSSSTPLVLETTEAKISCSSCGGTDHQRRNSSKCPLNKRQRME